MFHTEQGRSVGVPLSPRRPRTGRVLRCSPTCRGQRSRHCGGFLWSPPRCSRPQGHAYAGLPLRPLTRCFVVPPRNTGCDPFGVVRTTGVLSLQAVSPSGSNAQHRTRLGFMIPKKAQRTTASFWFLTLYGSQETPLHVWGFDPEGVTARSSSNPTGIRP